MNKLAKFVLADGGVHIGETGTSQYFFVGNLRLSLNFESTAEASLVEGANFSPA